MITAPALEDDLAEAKWLVHRVIPYVLILSVHKKMTPDMLLKTFYRAKRSKNPNRKSEFVNH